MRFARFTGDKITGGTTTGEIVGRVSDAIFGGSIDGNSWAF